MPEDLNEQAAMLLQGVDAEIQERIQQGESLYEAQFRTLHAKQKQYVVLSPEWRWFQPRVAGAYQELLQSEQAADRQETEKRRRGREVWIDKNYC